MFLSKLLCLDSQNALRPWWQQPLSFCNPPMQCQNGVMTLSPGKPRIVDNMHSFYELSNLCRE